MDEIQHRQREQCTLRAVNALVGRDQRVAQVEASKLAAEIFDRVKVRACRRTAPWVHEQKRQAATGGTPARREQRPAEANELGACWRYRRVAPVNSEAALLQELLA